MSERTVIDTTTPATKIGIALNKLKKKKTQVKLPFVTRALTYLDEAGAEFPLCTDFLGNFTDFDASKHTIIIPWSIFNSTVRSAWEKNINSGVSKFYMQKIFKLSSKSDVVYTDYDDFKAKVTADAPNILRNFISSSKRSILRKNLELLLDEVPDAAIVTQAVDTVLVPLSFMVDVQVSLPRVQSRPNAILIDTLINGGEFDDVVSMWKTAPQSTDNMDRDHIVQTTAGTLLASCEAMLNAYPTTTWNHASDTVMQTLNEATKTYKEVLAKTLTQLFEDEFNLHISENIQKYVNISLATAVESNAPSTILESTTSEEDFEVMRSVYTTLADGFREFLT